MQAAPFTIILSPIARRLASSLTASSFRTEFFLPSKPVIISGAHVLPAAKKWFDRLDDHTRFNTQYIRNHAATSTLELELRNLRARSVSRFTLPFAEAITILSAQTGQSWPAETNAYVAQSSLDDLSDELVSDLPTPQIVRESARGDVYGSSIWMGFPPTSTPLHRDPNPNLFVQLAGTKCFRMLDPTEGALVYQAAVGEGTGRIRGAEMLIGKESQRIEEWLWGEQIESPRTKNQARLQVKCWEAHLDEGDAIFIPVGWWHSVRGLGSGSSINASVSAGVLMGLG